MSSTLRSIGWYIAALIFGGAAIGNRETPIEAALWMICSLLCVILARLHEGRET